MIVRPDIAGLTFVATNMNALDRAEIFATRHDNDPDRLAEEALLSDHSYLCVSWDTPIGAFGAMQIWPRVWSFWMFSTDQFNRHAGTEILRHFRRVIAPDILGKSAHRAQCDSLKIHVTAHDFIRRFGGREEAEMRGYGKNGEDFIRFAWDSDSLLKNSSKLHIPTNQRINSPCLGERNVRPVIGT